MKICKLPSLSRGLFIPMAALALAVGFSLSAQAVTCTVENWDDHVGSLVPAPANQQTRYFAPCSLSVNLDGAPAWVENAFQQGTANPLDEELYNALFYVYFGDVAASSAEFVVFDMYNSTGLSVLGLAFDPAENELVVDAIGAAEQRLSLFAGRWHSVSIEWDAGSESVTVSVETALGVDSETVAFSLGTASGNIAAVRLGNVDGAGNGGELYADFFDSRRSTVPPRLVRGNATAKDEDPFPGYTISDVGATNNERIGIAIAPGQSNCTESGGFITISDVACVNNLRLGN